MSKEEDVTISKKRLNELLMAEDELNCLHNGGVGNWDWYGASLDDGGYYERWD